MRPMAATISLHVTSAPDSAAMERNAASVTSTMGDRTRGHLRCVPPMVMPAEVATGPRAKALRSAPSSRQGAADVSVRLEVPQRGLDAVGVLDLGADGLAAPAGTEVPQLAASAWR